MRKNDMRWDNRLGAGEEGRSKRINWVIRLELS